MAKVVTLRVPEARLAVIDAAAERRGVTRTKYLLWCEEVARTGSVQDPGTHAGRRVAGASLRREQVTPIYRDARNQRL